MDAREAVKAMLADPTFDPSEFFGDALVDWMMHNSNEVLKSNPCLCKYLMRSREFCVWRVIPLDSPDMDKMVVALKSYDYYYGQIAVHELLNRFADPTVPPAVLNDAWPHIKTLNLTTAPIELINRLTPEQATEIFHEFDPATINTDGVKLKIVAKLISIVPEDELERCDWIWHTQLWDIQRALILRFSHQMVMLSRLRSSMPDKAGVCQECGKKFSSKSGITLHWKARGDTHRPPSSLLDSILYGADAAFECAWKCGRRFTTQSAATLHSKVHCSAKVKID
jgi:hypothetical protein